METTILHKTCSSCGLEKPTSEFYPYIPKTPRVRKTKHDGFRPACKTCYTNKAKQWAAANPEKRKQIAKSWQANNPEKRKASVQKHAQTDKGKERMATWRKENRTAYLRERRKNDPLFSLKWKMRSIIQKALYRFGYTKRSRSEAVLGCTWAQLMAHIESQFQPGMTWENRGEWHIDHIIPLASVKTEEDVIRLNHYTNLQPLWAEDNLRKSDKLDFQP